jgi:PIN domain nuclease of toxin-antitoxin system
MKYLLDTHIFLWLLTTPERIGSVADHLARSSSTLSVSAASSWEIAIKYQRGALRFPNHLSTMFLHDYEP